MTEEEKKPEEVPQKPPKQVKKVKKEDRYRFIVVYYDNPTEQIKEMTFKKFEDMTAFVAKLECTDDEIKIYRGVPISFGGRERVTRMMINGAIVTPED